MEIKNPPRMMDASLQITQFRTFAIDDERRQSSDLISLSDNGSEARSFNILRSTFLKKMKEGGKRLVGVTSAMPSEGKSFLSTNLALSLAKVSPDPVFLVDLDFRRPSLATTLGFQVQHSIDHYLTGKVDELSKVGARLEGTNLAIFPSLKTKQSSAELLSGQRFTEMLAIFKEKSDASTILFDLPPAFADDDAMICLGHLDGYILVVEASRTTTKQVQKTIEMLAPSPCIGTVLNRYQGGFGDPYGYGYGYGGYEAYYD